jgi:hypothetical protein
MSATSSNAAVRAWPWVALGVLPLAALVWPGVTLAEDDLGEQGASTKERMPPPDALAALGKPRVRKVAVPAFAGQGAESLRQAVLDVLSEHPDLEIVGQPDLEVVAHRIGAAIDKDRDRSKLSTELGLYAWVDGDAETGRLRLTDGSGKVISSLALPRGQAGAVQARDRVWPALGRFVSDEGMREYVIIARKEAAVRKLEAQEAELAHQRKLFEQRAQVRAERLAAMQTRAKKRLAGQHAELEHQSELAVERVRKEQKEAARQAELARKAELAQQAEAAKQAEAARQAELARQAEAAKQAAAARQAELAQQAEMARQQNAYASQASPQPGYGYPAAGPAMQPAAAPTYGAPTASTGAFADNASPAGHAWVQRQQAGRAAAPAPTAGYAAAPAAGYAPAPASGFAPAPATQPVPGEVPGISPETRQWLLEHRARQQGN